MKPICLVDFAKSYRRAGVVALAALAVTGAAGSALASPTINAVFAGAGFSDADKAVVQNALDFYAANMTSTFTMTVAFGARPAGGGSSEFVNDGIFYNAFYNALVANSSGGSTDTSAIASLGGGAHLTDPVEGSIGIVLTSTLASLLGLAPQVSAPFSDCGNLVASACIVLGSPALNSSGAPSDGLFGLVQHEFDEVLGTASALNSFGGPTPINPDVADLYRYAAPGVRSFADNTSTSVPCTGSPIAYFSVDGGVTNEQAYNNCNNGGDYGDWIGTDGMLVQDAFGPPTGAVASLNALSPEVKLLDAIGYNFGEGSSSGAPEPETWALMILGLGAVGAAMRSRRRMTLAAAQ